eukprot:g10122.t1
MAETAPATPFPWLPMLAIAVGPVSHSYALTSLFPYVGYMVQSLGVTDDKDEAGYYAGFIASAFMIGRVGSSYFWGRFADQYGRLPVVYVGLGSMVVLSIAFGLSTTFVWALSCRFLLGVTNGLLGISKTMISEVCGKEHETVGMSAILGCGSVGLVVGPGLGGLLSEPAKHYSTVFSESGLFGRFPYLLPNIVGASLALTGLPLVFFFLKETKHLHHSGGASRGDFKPHRTKGAGDAETDAAEDEEDSEMLEMIPWTRANSLESGRAGREDVVLSDNLADSRVIGHIEDEEAPENIEPVGDDNASVAGDTQGEGHRLLSSQRGKNEQWGIAREVKDVDMDGRRRIKRRRGGRACSACWKECLVPVKLLQDKRTRSIVFVYSIFSFIVIGSREVYPLWALSTVQAGGIDWTTKEIGEALSVCGIGMLIFQLLVYPWLSKRMGVTRSQRYACLLSMPVFLAFPSLSLLRDSEAALVAASLVLLFLANVVSNAVFINISLAINNAVDPSRRATLNGLSMTLASVAKAAGPTFFSAIFAWSVDGHDRPFPLDHHLAFYLLALGMVVVSWASWDTIVSEDSIPAGGKFAVLREPKMKQQQTEAAAAAAAAAAELQLLLQLLLLQLLLLQPVAGAVPVPSPLAALATAQPAVATPSAQAAGAKTIDKKKKA